MGSGEGRREGGREGGREGRGGRKGGRQVSHIQHTSLAYSKSGRWKRVMLARQLHRWEQQLFLENLQRKRQPQTEGDDPPDCTEARSGRWERVVLTRQLPLAVIPRVSAMEEAISNWGRWPNRRLHRGKLWSPRESDARPTIAQMRAAVILENMQWKRRPQTEGDGAWPSSSWAAVVPGMIS